MCVVQEARASKFGGDKGNMDKADTDEVPGNQTSDVSFPNPYSAKHIRHLLLVLLASTY